MYTEERPYIPAELRRQIETESGHACAVHRCGEHTYLDIHHIDENRENNAADNLILLCVKHHRMAHAKEISRKDLHEYKKMLKDRQLQQPLVNNHNFTNFYLNLLAVAKNKLMLASWNLISENLGANGIQDSVLDGFIDFHNVITSTNFPKELPTLESSLVELSHSAMKIVNHFKYSNHACYLENTSFWVRDNSWKKIWVSQAAYDEKNSASEAWSLQLQNIQKEFVCSLNNFANEVRNSIDPEFFMRQSFTVAI